jgi:hypothetical protein
MLFYRRKSLNKRLGKKVDPPVWLLNEVNQRNIELKEQRLLYEKLENETKINIYLDLDFSIDSQKENLLVLNDQNSCLSLSVDKRCLVKDLVEKTIEYCTESSKQKNSIGSREGMLLSFFDWLFRNLV